MRITVESTTDSKESVAAVNAEAKPNTEEVDKKLSVSPDGEKPKADEKPPEESETSEELETEEETEESEESGEKLETQGDKPKKKTGYQRRIEKFAKRLSAAEQDVAYWREQALKGKPNPETTQNTEKPVKSDKEPKQEDFETHAEFVRAIARWEAKQEFENERKQEQTQKLKDEYANKVKAHTERVKKFADAKDDFHEVLEGVNEIPLSPVVEDLILESENGPELMYELAKDAKEFARICGLGPLAAARAVGKIEARLEKTETTETTTEKTKTTKAPTPITPLSPKNAGAGKKSIYDAQEMSQAEYEKIRREQKKASARL